MARTKLPCPIIAITPIPSPLYSFSFVSPSRDSYPLVDIHHYQARTGQDRAKTVVNLPLEIPPTKKHVTRAR